MTSFVKATFLFIILWTKFRGMIFREPSLSVKPFIFSRIIKHFSILYRPYANMAAAN